MHQQVRHRVAVKHYSQYPLHRLDLCLVRALLQLILEILLGRQICSIVKLYEAVRIVDKGCHDGQNCR